jgi:CubicO group peptidase (beta-lactamase class C family)
MTAGSPAVVAKEVQAVVEEAVEAALEGGEVGIGVAVYHEGELVADVVGGIADEATGAPVDEDTVFWIGSVTKGFTAMALHIQAERGLVDYAAPVAQYWPEFGAHGKDRATVLDALSHRSGVPVFPLDAEPETMSDWDWVVDRIADAHPLYEPGTRNSYHSYTFGWIIGEIVRRTDPKGRAFRDFIHEELFRPLGAQDIWFGIPDEVEPRVANVTDVARTASNYPYPYERVVAIPPVLNATQAVFGRSDVRRSCNPAAGAIANAKSCARVYAMCAQGGELDGVRLLSEQRIRLFSAPRPLGWDLVLGDHTRMGIAGFWIANPSEGTASPIGSSLSAFGHNGAGGSISWCDPAHRLAIGITTNRLGGGRLTPEENTLLPVADAIRRALGVEAA